MPANALSVDSFLFGSGFDDMDFKASVHAATIVTANRKMTHSSFSAMTKENQSHSYKLKVAEEITRKPCTVKK